MKATVFAVRNARELLRDPLNLAFGLGFPLVLLFLFTAIQANIPVSMFELGKIAPGLAVFGYSFLALFSGMLIAKDRSSAFLMRLFASPLTASQFILGYMLPLLPLALAQSLICYIVAFFLGLPVSINVLVALVVQIPSALLFISIGLWAGSVLTDKQVGGICGALLTNLSAWLSGTWFDLALVGGAFNAIAQALPFVHATEAAKAAMAGNYTAIMPHLWWVLGYTAVVTVLAIMAFKKKMRSDKI
jgi:ABC-2 type transport system permease protein